MFVSYENEAISLHFVVVVETRQSFTTACPNFSCSGKKFVIMALFDH